MEIKLKIKFFKYIAFNVLLFLILYNIPIEAGFLKNICLIKLITGKECWNCGMTRAFLSVLHLQFQRAYSFNKNVIIVFPLTVGIYIYSSCKYLCNINRRKKI